MLLRVGIRESLKKTGWGSAHVGGVHAHHMVFGIVIAFTSGALMFAFLPQQGFLLLLLAAAFGSGMALVLDEFALIFHLQDVYWENEGRKSIDAVVLATALSSLFLLRATPLGVSSQDTGMLLFLTILLNSLIVLMAALKGKIYLALFGIFIPTISLIAAIRLAEPGSVWARKLYKHKPKKLQRSVTRYARYGAVWRKRKEWAWDLIGGKIGRPTIKKT